MTLSVLICNSYYQLAKLSRFTTSQNGAVKQAVVGRRPRRIATMTVARYS